jgi:hypothetical protein
MTFADWTGSFGVFLILLAYILNITSRLNVKDLPFILLNLLGASLACLASWLIGYYPFVVLEAVWAMASVYGLIINLKDH